MFVIAGIFPCIFRTVCCGLRLHKAD